MTISDKIKKAAFYDVYQMQEDSRRTKGVLSCSQCLYTCTFINTSGYSVRGRHKITSPLPSPDINISTLSPHILQQSLQPVVQPQCRYHFFAHRISTCSERLIYCVAWRADPWDATRGARETGNDVIASLTGVFLQHLYCLKGCIWADLINQIPF